VRVLVPAILVLSPSISGAQTGELSPLFADDAPLRLTIAMDFDAVLKDRSDDPADQPATLYEGDGETAPRHTGENPRFLSTALHQL
jgi:hypothetical protein